MHNVIAHGASIPALGFGVFRMSGAEVEQIVPLALETGFRHFDTAQIYENEADLGRALEKAGAKRDDLFITTKIWIDNYPAEKFAASVDESLDKLRMDHVDLLLLHWPNDKVPLADQIASLNAVKAAGKARHIGVSNLPTKLMAEAIALSEAPLVTNQVEYQPYLDQTAVLEAARAAGLSLTAYYAMADGKVVTDPAIQAIGARYGKSAAQVVLRWLVQQEGVIALSKTANPKRISENFAIFDFTLSDEDMAAIHALARPDGRIVSPPGLAPVWDR
ncbi:2,5-didehydrogluconate reductase [Sphingomonas oleivorans]|uniref:2,5-didehydrogluconate reductase n=1 Tax=Sphingomonas oleivorans TaxID=1735121 RepID=A0A2T5FTP3_9SPHN|nr:aldo/keto reductase [Sphingomonas oleivorans]PTQ07441.1 2,5-didehydrogluconate reductase [Sphingomonas oleivorans]